MQSISTHTTHWSFVETWCFFTCDQSHWLLCRSGLCFKYFFFLLSIEWSASSIESFVWNEPAAWAWHRTYDMLVSLLSTTAIDPMFTTDFFFMRNRFFFSIRIIFFFISFIFFHAKMYPQAKHKRLEEPDKRMEIKINNLLHFKQYI